MRVSSIIDVEGKKINDLRQRGGQVGFELKRVRSRIERLLRFCTAWFLFLCYFIFCFCFLSSGGGVVNKTFFIFCFVFKSLLSRSSL